MDEIQYNINTFLNTNNYNEETIEKNFNQKLLKIILGLEKNNGDCQG